ncbi:o-succinylbenzoate--CoA ligase [Pasteurella bettyae]|uniref:O-succinylbenzoate-CoA ligase n=1 Tax=Pasteurella bettyae CCUG 2042 TaxID=1095749 RepID=I3DEG5_9PAST|nr:o-succinylbenzoate--CoA ligase [Pasteurella bettyae]EIJ70108.1 O-succinylbenzoate-CoA ligase [Pasteurella bettyae CCUG 2042]SUB21984.1 2-succinylbenzoate--CoA ligase [Pasteurella bettyae]
MSFLWQQYAELEQFKHKIALRDFSQGEVFTWQQINSRIQCALQTLRDHSLQPGQGIALCGKNSLDIVCYYLAGLQLGLRVLMLNPAFTAEKISQLCKVNKITYCLFFSSQLDRLELTQNFSETDRSFDLNEGYTLTLTSGSTGLPKAVVHNINAHLANAEGVCELMHFGCQDSWLLSLPLYHVSGQGVIWRWLNVGAELHLAGSDFYASVLHATHVSLVPTQLQRLLTYLSASQIDKYHTKHILLGGSQIPVDLTSQLKSFDIQCYSGYGMTEMASTVFAKKSDGKVGVGQALKGREYQLVDQEVWLKGAGLASGYWIENHIQSLTNPQGWFQTRDKAQWLDDELVILGRLDNMFISGGENIQPEDIEKCIQRHVSVAQVFILPKDDPEFGQRPVAMVQFHPAYEFKSAVENLKIWLSDRIEKFKQPIIYFPLDVEKYQQQGSIKISRSLLKAELVKLLGN